MPTSKQDDQFIEVVNDGVEVIHSNNTLDNAIAWIDENLDPEQVFNDRKLETWAEENGYVKVQS